MVPDKRVSDSRIRRILFGKRRFSCASFGLTHQLKAVFLFFFTKSQAKSVSSKFVSTLPYLSIIR